MADGDFTGSAPASESQSPTDLMRQVHNVAQELHLCAEITREELAREALDGTERARYMMDRSAEALDKLFELIESIEARFQARGELPEGPLFDDPYHEQKLARIRQGELPVRW